MDYPATWQNEILAARDENENASVVICAVKTDNQLAELVLSGDETAFEQIFDRYKRLVAAIAGRYLKRPEQIEEIIQISFSKVYFELKNFRGAHDFSLAGWIGRIATNACLDALRNQKRKPEDLICELSTEEAEFLFADESQANKTAETLFIERDLAEKLLSSLTAEDRALLQMLYDEEMTVVEVAEVTGWSRSKIKVRAFRARNALRKVLKRFL
jgi:RNA polymerase sigma-70 factor (ECF subfamily)